MDPRSVLRVCDGYGRRLGHCVEQFRFADWDKLPKAVRVLRNRTHFVDILNAFHNEDILYYSKRIDIKEPAAFPSTRARTCCWTSSRFDISDFLRHADEVLDEPQGGMDDAVGGDKVYHMDMVRKITHRCGSDLERFRIVLTMRASGASTRSSRCSSPPATTNIKDDHEHSFYRHRARHPAHCPVPASRHPDPYADIAREVGD